MVAKGYGVSFGGDESVLKLTVVTSTPGVGVSCETPTKLTVVMVVGICDYAKTWSTLNRNIVGVLIITQKLI